MLTIISDIHFTDSSCGRTLESGAFKKFTQYLEDMVESAQAKELEIVFLGDIFDIIRSDYWLRSQIRPWSKDEEVDSEGNGLQQYCKEIMTRICDNPINKESIQYMHNFKDRMSSNGVSVNYTYIIGNHDWLVNNYIDTRTMAARFLGINIPSQFLDICIPTEAFWANYSVYARHGDRYDSFNYAYKRDRLSSIGDAIVIDLINKFPEKVEDSIGCATDPYLIACLKEIDNVRPIADIPKWVQVTCKRAKTKEIGKRVKNIWNSMVKDFLKIKFVKSHNKPWRLDNADILQLGLGLSKYLSLRSISNLPLKLFKSGANYEKHAFNEKTEANFIVYGHTHNYKVQPLNNQKIYFNTGTWRKVQIKNSYGNEFTSMSVLTFISFYKDGERNGRKFEVWDGVLGD